MAKRYDSTLKDLMTNYPEDWLGQMGITFQGPVEIRDSSLSTVTADADKIMVVHSPAPCVLNLEPMSSRDEDAPKRTLLYGALVYVKYDLPVHSVMILLRKKANHPDLTGHVGYQSPLGAKSSLHFSFEIVKVWELPVENILRGGVGTLPLAPLADVRRKDLPEIIEKMKVRLGQETEPGEAAMLWSATYILMGLRYPVKLADQLLQGVRNMKESVTYQAIIQEGKKEGKMEGQREGRREGRREEARRLLLLQARTLFGPPSAAAEAKLRSVSTVSQLERLAERLVQVKSWEDLLSS